MTNDTFQCPHPTCPHCGHEMTTDEMISGEGDLFALAPDEGLAGVECPSCNKNYWVRGGYKPHYTSATEEDHL